MTAKPHGRDCPDRCSQCLGAAVHRVDQDGSALTIGGKPVRAIALGEMPVRDYYRAQRGGRRGGPARARKLRRP